MEFRGLQIYNSKFLAEEALRKRKKLTKILEEKRANSMQGNKRALGNSGGDKSNLVQYSSEVQKLKNDKIKRAKDLYKKGYSKNFPYWRCLHFCYPQNNSQCNYWVLDKYEIK